MRTDYRKELITCLGDPIDENPTIVIMEAAFKALGLDYVYDGVLVHPEDLEAAVSGIKAMNFKGSHVTVPHKVEIMKYLDEIDEDARIIGAVNTVYRKGDRLCGANTDGKGFMAGLREAGINPEGKLATILGAGGAAKAISIELGLAGCKQINIINRTEEKGRNLVKAINDNTPAHAVYIPWTPHVDIPSDTEIFIDATSIGLYPDTSVADINFDSLKPGMMVCDVVHNPPHTQFLKNAAERGCGIIEGLPMLIAQAIVSLKIWSGLEAPKDVMEKALLAEEEE